MKKKIFIKNQLRIYPKVVVKTMNMQKTSSARILKAGFYQEKQQVLLTSFAGRP